MNNNFRKELFDSDNNFYIWTISGVKSQIYNDYKEVQNTNVFKLSPFGYKIAAQAKFESGYLGIYVILVAGKYDKLLKWPFENSIKIILMNQSNPNANHSIVIDPKNMKNELCWQRPIMNVNQKGCGLKTAFPLSLFKKTQNGYPSEFLRNDQIYLKFELLKN